MANQECIFVSRPGPDGAKPSDFKVQDCDVPACGVSEVLVQARLFSCDPAMRTYMTVGTDQISKQEGILYYNTYAASWQPGKPPAGSVVGDVIASRDSSIPVGALVEGQLPWRKISSVKGRGLRMLDKAISAEDHISVLGGTGMAAYLPIVHIGNAKAGEVAFVSAAAGATGSSAVQILRNLGCTVVGSAGSDEKVEMLSNLGISAFNYNKENTIDALQRLCPKGVDIFFDNVGGATLEAALEVMRDFGRVINCGAVSQYDLPVEKRYGIRNLFHITAKRLTLRGFVTDPVSFTPENFDEARKTMGGWLKEGKLKGECTVRDGFEHLPSSLLGLLKGQNTGKMLVRVAPQDAPVVPLPQMPVVEFLFSLDLVLTSVISTISKGSNGRGLVGITGGSFTGPKLKGTVLPVGGDWATIVDNGTTKVDVRATLQTHDGAYILMFYGGRGDATGDKRIVSQPLFETIDERYMWMNRVVAIGVGRGTTWGKYGDGGGKASYDVFRVVLPKL